MKKVLIIIGVVILTAVIGLYIYSRGGYQDIHIAKGEHLDDAISKPVKDLIDMEYERQIWESDLEKDDSKNFFTKAWHRWNYAYSGKIFYEDNEYIYWGRIRSDFFRNEVTALYKTDRATYDKAMEQFDHFTLEKAQEMIAKYYNSRRFVLEQKIVEPKDVRLYKVRIPGNDNYSGIPDNIEFKVFIEGNIYDAYSRDGKEVYRMTSSSLITY